MKTLALVVALLSASATAYYADRLNEDGTLSKAARKSKVTGACTQCSASGSYMVHTFLPSLGTARPLPRKSCRMFALAYPTSNAISTAATPTQWCANHFFLINSLLTKLLLLILCVVYLERAHIGFWQASTARSTGPTRSSKR